MVRARTVTASTLGPPGRISTSWVGRARRGRRWGQPVGLLGIGRAEQEDVAEGMVHDEAGDRAERVRARARVGAEARPDRNQVCPLFGRRRDDLPLGTTAPAE